MAVSSLSLAKECSYATALLVAGWTPAITTLSSASNVLWNQGLCEYTKMNIAALTMLAAFGTVFAAVCYSMTGQYTLPKDSSSKTWIAPTHLALSGLMNVFAYYVYHGSFFTQNQFISSSLQLASIGYLFIPIQVAQSEMHSYLAISNQNQLDKVYLSSNIATIFSSLIASGVMSRSSFDPILNTGVRIGTFFAVSLIAFPIFASIFTKEIAFQK